MAIKDRQDLERLLLGRRRRKGALVVGLDFDGTLSPLVRRPGMARLPAGTRRRLALLARHPRIRLAIISGRSLADIMARVRLRGIFYSGNHGLEIRGPRGVWRHPKALAAAGELRALARRLKPALAPFPGAWLEDKDLTLSVHHRAMATRRGPALRGVLSRTLRPHAKSLVMAQGKKTWEFRPKVRWNKGHALLKIARPSGAGAIVFVGDDRTDEDGFRTLGARAVTVRVGPAKDSAARFLLPRQSDVDPILELLLGR